MQLTLAKQRLIQKARGFVKGNNLWKSSFFIMISQSTSVVLLLLADALFARRFTTTDFATWKQLALLINLGIPLVSFGLPEGFKYYAAKDTEHSNLHLVRCIIAATIIACILLVVMWSGGTAFIAKSFKNTNLLYFGTGSVILFLSVTFSRLIRNYLINHDITTYLFTSAILCMIIGVIQLAFIYFEYKNVTERFLCNWLLSLLCLMFLSSVLTFFFKEGFKIFKIKKGDGSLFKFSPYFKIGLPLYIATFIGVLTLNLDKAIVNKLGSLKDFAVYSVGAIEIPLFSMISASVAQSTFPKFVGFYRTGEIQSGKDLWIYTTKRISHITYPIILLLMIFASPLVKLVFTAKFAAAIPIFKTYLLVSLWRNNYYGALISASGKTRWITFYSFVSFVLNVGFSIALYYLWGLIGIAYGAFLAASVTALWQLQHEKILLSWLKNIIFDKIILGLITLILLAYFFI
jgi:O-antigen/teichoic acid export membrane protein